MAGYHLCRHKTADTPFFIENIQVSVRTIEELAYFFGRFPALLDETVMRKELVQWINGEINLPRTAIRMDEALAEGSSKNFAMPVLKEAGLFSSRELVYVTSVYERLDAMRPVARKKAVADALLRCGKLSAAIETYRYVSDALSVNAHDPEMMAACWHDRGVAEMRLMLYEEALSSFRRAMHASEKEKYRTDYLSALFIARPFDRREQEIENEHITEEEILMAEELVAGARTESAEDESYQPPEGYLSGLTSDYHKATGL